ncbi:hypothetical protein Cni_G19798 [Canna indica]|uniref:DUF3741 domain-containing protein n=1 Tax=Canna indica TaxID=4628 RepID=A0AAQ3KL89_9LILI|nr:hypothetical protein Cni_G19798 [Canna indica]
MLFNEESDMHLLEISRPAHKLTDMIDSSRYVGNDLLKESLQSTKMMMPHMKERKRLEFFGQRELAERRLIDDIAVDQLQRTTARNYRNKLQEDDKILGSRSWRSCNEELKKVIRESLLLNSSDDEKASSSRSLGSYIRSGFDFSNHEEEMMMMMMMKKKKTTTASDQPTKMKAPNLIARLMGLGEVPAEAAKPTVKTKLRRENPNATRLRFHVEMPEARRLVFLEQDPKPERVTLQSIIEREKIERLMKRGHEQDFGDQSGSSNTSVNEQCSKRFHRDEQASSAKAMQISAWEREREEEKEDFNSRKYSTKESAQSAKIKHEEIINMNDRQRLEHESGRKEARILKKTKLEMSKYSRMPTSSCNGQMQNEAAKTLKKIDESQKSGFSRLNLQSKKDVKASAASLSQAKKTATTSTEPQRRPDTAKRNVLTKRGASQKSSMMTDKNLVVKKSSTHAIEKKTTGVKPAQKMPKLKTTKQKDASVIINISPAAEPPQQKQLSLKCSNNEQPKKEQKIICEIMPKANKAGSSLGKAETVVVKHVDNELIDTKRAEDKVEYLENLLLGCQSFLHACDLSLDEAHISTQHETMDINKVDKDVKLYLSCAKELILRKRYHQQLFTHPLLLNCSRRSMEHAPLHELVGEISKGIGRLASYSEVDQEVTSKDSLYVRLEKDLEYKDMVLNAMWDVDWRNGIWVVEADHVVGQVEEHVLSVLVEEFAMELVNCCSHINNSV